MTRDDLKLKIVVAFAVIVALATLSEGTVKTIGLPLGIIPWLPWFRLVSFVGGVISAQLGTSPLPGKPPAPVSDGTLARINHDQSLKT